MRKFIVIVLVVVALTRYLLVTLSEHNEFHALSDSMVSADSTKNAALLNEMSRRTEILLSHVADGLEKQTPWMKARTQLLLRARGHIEFAQTPPVTEGVPPPVAYKMGDTVFLCLTGDPSADLLFTIVVHELAHYMDPETTPLVNGHSVHGQRFKQDERWLLKMSERLSLSVRGGPIGRNFCGISIPDPLESQ